jgi:hypothetical protein
MQTKVAVIAADALQHEADRPTAQARGQVGTRLDTLQPEEQAHRHYSKIANAGPRLAAQRRGADAVQRKTADDARPPNRTGLPDRLKLGIESLSGISMDAVNVHYNSLQPAQLNAHAYAQGTDIHVAPGRERHLPHEAWHVVQQAQGRVRPTVQMKGKEGINDDPVLEQEADVMGARAMSAAPTPISALGGQQFDNDQAVAVVQPFRGSGQNSTAGGTQQKRSKRGREQEGPVGSETLNPAEAAGVGENDDAVEPPAKRQERESERKDPANGADDADMPDPLPDAVNVGADVIMAVKPEHEKTTISHKSGSFIWRNVPYEVGTEMTAVLNANSPVRGSATGAMTEWGQSVNRAHGGNVVRGHLLNHDLGGMGVPPNLYPISSSANSEHSLQVERNVKKQLNLAVKAKDRTPFVAYTVNVTDRIDPIKATFRCRWSPPEATRGDAIAKLGQEVDIKSDLSKIVKVPYLQSPDMIQKLANARKEKDPSKRWKILYGGKDSAEWHPAEAWWHQARKQNAVDGQSTWDQHYVGSVSDRAEFSYTPTSLNAPQIISSSVGVDEMLFLNLEQFKRRVFGDYGVKKNITLVADYFRSLSAANVERKIRSLIGAKSKGWLSIIYSELGNENSEKWYVEFLYRVNQYLDINSGGDETCAVDIKEWEMENRRRRNKSKV